MAKERLIDRLKNAKGWSTREKYSYDLIDADGDVIETIYLKALSRDNYIKARAGAEAAGKADDLSLRLIVCSCFLADGSPAFDVADVVTLKKEIGSNRLNDLEMAVLNAGKEVDLEQEKKD